MRALAFTAVIAVASAAFAHGPMPPVPPDLPALVDLIEAPLPFDAPVSYVDILEDHTYTLDPVPPNGYRGDAWNAICGWVMSCWSEPAPGGGPPIVVCDVRFGQAGNHDGEVMAAWAYGFDGLYAGHPSPDCGARPVP